MSASPTPRPAALPRREPAAAPDRHLPLAGTRNLRDVGGYACGNGRRTRWRTLLRTDALDRLPRASQDALLDLGLRQVIDLRWPHELDEAPSVFSSSGRLRYLSIPLLEDDPTPALGLAGTYRHMLDVRGPQLAAVALALVRTGGLPAVIGCAAGKDRTGVAIAVILSAIGVARDDVIADYALSAELFAADHEDEHLVDWRAGPVVIESPPEYMREALDHLDASHGGATALLRRHGVSARDLERLTEALTEPSDVVPGEMTG